MTEEKKNGKITEPVDNKKPDTEGEDKEIKTPEKVEAKDAIEKNEQVKEPKVEKKNESEEKPEIKTAPEKTETQNKEQKSVDPPKEEIEVKAEESVTEEIEKKDEEPIQEIKSKKDLGNLNFYPELRTDLPEIRSGDITKIYYRVLEGGKERIQIFEGTVIAMKNSGIAKTITVRKTSFGISIERIFPLNSKLLQKIEVIKHSRVRRAKLYYLRNLKGKAARLKELR